MNFLNRAYNAAGPVPQKRKDQIIAYFRNAEPTTEEFAAIARTCLNHKHNIRSAVPDGFTVARAIKAALAA